MKEIEETRITGVECHRASFDNPIPGIRFVLDRVPALQYRSPHVSPHPRIPRSRRANDHRGHFDLCFSIARLSLRRRADESRHGKRK